VFCLLTQGATIGRRIGFNYAMIRLVPTAATPGHNRACF
jgi:hypothetical protein